MNSRSKRVDRMELRTIGSTNALPIETTPIPNEKTPLNLFRAKMDGGVAFREDRMYGCPLMFKILVKCMFGEYI